MTSAENSPDDASSGNESKGDGLRGLPVDVGHDDQPRTLVVEATRERCPDPVAATGDENSRIAQVVTHVEVLP